MTNSTVPSDAQLQNELRNIRHQSKSIRISHCVKRFMTWRKAGLSPNEIKAEYKLGDYDMYVTIIDAVQKETGLDRDLLLKYPGRRRGDHRVSSRGSKTTEALSEARKLINLYETLIEQAECLQHTIAKTISRR